MRFLILSQVFWPDNVAVSLFVTDLAKKLAAKGHQVDVICASHDYEDHTKKYSHHNKLDTVNIKRLKTLGLGKRTQLTRLIDFIHFNYLVLIQLLKIKKGQYDAAISTTVPPMLSFFTALFSKIKKYDFIYWTMDLQPELSIQSGLILRKSIAAKFLTQMGDYTFRKADHILVLDDYMRNHVYRRCLQPDKIKISSLWPVMQQTYEGDRLQNEFRESQRWGNKTVIMYAGNHSYVHPLDTLLQAALKLKYCHDLIFAFVGSGVRKSEVTAFKHRHQLKNIIQLPFQPREKVHISLGAADIQVVILGEDLVGYTHPNKIYGALYTGKPIVYIGPQPSHVTDILKECPGNLLLSHGESDKLCTGLEQWLIDPHEMNQIGKNNQAYAKKNFNPEHLRDKLVMQIESIAEKSL